MLDLDLHWCDGAVGTAATDGVHICVACVFLSLANASQRAFLLAHRGVA